MNMKLQHVLRLLCLFCCATSVVTAQQPAADKPELPKLGSIKGRVIGEDGQPLAGIPVMAIPIGARNAGGFGQGIGRQGGQPAAPSQATTDDDGNFEFTNLLPASYAISASVPGYVAPLPEAEEESRTGLYLVGEFASITLVKGGVITGKVFNSGGEPVTGISVSAIRTGNLNGEPDELSLARGFGRNWRTDDQGVYRIYGLMAGTYIVQAGQLGQGGQPGRPGGPAGGGLSPFSGNAPTYYPSSARDAAIPLTIRPGYEASGIDIRYRAEKGRSIGGKAIAAKTTDNNDFSPTEIRLSVAGTDSVIATATQAGRGQSPGFAFYGIPDGDYEVSARRAGNRGESDSVSETRRFAVRGADVVGLQLTLAPLALLNGKVVIEKAAANSAAACPVPRKFFVQEISLAAQRDDASTTSGASATVNKRFNLLRSTIPAVTGDYVFRNLESGRWRLSAQLPDDNWYVRAISPPNLNNLASAGRKSVQTAALPNIARNGAMLKGGEKITGVTITVAEGAASLKGNLVNEQGSNLGKRQIHLIPAEKEFADDVLRYAQTNASTEGAFHFKNLPPGRYWLLTKPVKELSAGAAVHLLAWDNAQRAALRKEAEAAGNIVELAVCQHIAGYKLNIK